MMELAERIVDVAEQRFKRDFCNIDIEFSEHHNFDCGHTTFSIVAVPRADYVLLHFKTMQLKLMRSDRHGYEEGVDFLVQLIKDEAEGLDHLYAGEMQFLYAYVSVSCRDKLVSNAQFDYESCPDKAWAKLKSTLMGTRHLACF